MSHYLVSKKIWICAAGLTCLFLLMAFAWFHLVNQVIVQSEIVTQEEQDETENRIIQGSPIETAVEEVVRQTQKPVQELRSEMAFPCIVQIKEETIGIYAPDGQCYKVLYQSGELMREEDRQLLQNGIYVENEAELISLCESYHLQ